MGHCNTQHGCTKQYKLPLGIIKVMNMDLVVQTCCPKELQCVLLQLVEDIDPDVIADTIIALAPHIQTGNKTTPIYDLMTS